MSRYSEALKFGVAGVGVRTVEERVVRAEDRCEGSDFRVGVDAFIEPGVFELVGRDHAVPVLMAELVHGGELGEVGRVVPRGVTSDEGGVFHAADLGAGFGVDDGDYLVGIRTVEVVEVGHGSLDDVKVASAGLGVDGQREDVNFDGTEGGE